MKNIDIARLCLTAEETTQIQVLLASLSQRYRSADDADFILHLAAWSAELPRRVRFFCDEFRLGERAVGCLIAGIPINDDTIGDSPTTLGRGRKKNIQELELEFLQAMLGAQFGDLFCWGAQHEGALIHDLAPVPQHADLQFGTGSQFELAWHTEDAFSECRCDFIGLLCVRNPQGVATTVGTLDVDMLTPEQIALLSAPKFTIRPDASYIIPGVGEAPTAKNISVLYGHPDRPYLRLDPTYMDTPEEPEARAALAAAIARVQESLTPIVIQAGELLILDNHRTVHGRSGFQANFNGKDRWVKRMSITRDLRKSCQLRQSPNDRVISFVEYQKGNRMKLFYSPGTCATACHIALEESGLNYRTIEVDLATHRHSNGDFTEINPKGYVPALELDSGEHLTEVSAILQYVADLAPERGLIPPSGSMDRYRAQEWLNYIAAEVHKVFAPLWDNQALPEVVQTAKNELARKFDFIAERLNNRAFLLGSRYSVADTYLFCIINWTPLFKIDMTRWPALMSYMERIESRPAVNKVLMLEGLNTPAAA